MSRRSAAGSDSPGSTLPPGNSHCPVRPSRSGRRVIRISSPRGPPRRRRAAASREVEREELAAVREDVDAIAVDGRGPGDAGAGVERSQRAAGGRLDEAEPGRAGGQPGSSSPGPDRLPGAGRALERRAPQRGAAGRREADQGCLGVPPPPGGGRRRADDRPRGRETTHTTSPESASRAEHRAGERGGVEPAVQGSAARRRRGSRRQAPPAAPSETSPFPASSAADEAVGVPGEHHARAHNDRPGRAADGEARTWPRGGGATSRRRSLASTAKSVSCRLITKTVPSTTTGRVPSSSLAS